MCNILVITQLMMIYEKMMNMINIRITKFSTNYKINNTSPSEISLGGGVGSKKIILKNILKSYLFFYIALPLPFWLTRLQRHVMIYSAVYNCYIYYVIIFSCIHSY